MLRRPLLTLAAVALLAGLLVGCGADAADPAPAGESGSTGSATATVTAEPSADVATPRAGRRGARPSSPGPEESDQLGDLAALAEQQSGRQRREAARRGPVLGGDISWPQCPKGLGIPEKRTLGLPPPLPTAEYVVVGLTNGPGFVENPCLADQVSFVRGQGLGLAAYAVVSYPDQRTLSREGVDGPYDGGSTLDALRNVGYAQAEFGVASMKRTGLVTPVVWVDVEPVNDFEWSGDTTANAAVVEGAVRGYEDAGYRVGVYSTAYLWQGVVGGLRLGVPEWRAAGQTSRAEALSRCADDASIQGGKAVMGQWVEDSRDQNVTCPGISGELGRWFSGVG